MGELIATVELLARTGLSRSQFKYRRALHPDTVVPSRQIGRCLLWRPELVEALLAMQIGRKCS